MRHGRLFGVILGLFIARSAPAEDEALKQALALEASIQKVVEKAETSVACILVSRSDGYARVDPASARVPKVPGKLGDYRPRTDVPFPLRNPADSEMLKRLNLAAPDAVPDSYGTGVVIDESQALILTNLHVIRDATKVFVRLPGRKGSYADIHAADERSDLAVLKLIDPPAGLRALPMGDAGNLKKGQFVLSIANPWAAGFRDGSPSISWGLLSNVRRRLPGEPNEGPQRRPRLHYYPVLLQTTLNIAPGCSGGALLDLRGNWIGLTTALSGVAGGEGSGGYAIPLDTRMKRIIEKLRKGEEVEYGFLGISQTLGGGIDRAWQPTPGGPADLAGMSPGDVILSIEGEPITEQDDMLLNIGASLAGTKIRMTVDSRGKRRELWPVLVKTSWPSTGPVIASNRPKPVHGLRVDYTSVLIQTSGGGSTRVPPGVVVREVEDYSPAAKAELRPDRDIIIAVNGMAVNTPRDFYRLAREARGEIELTLYESGRRVKLP